MDFGDSYFQKGYDITKYQEERCVLNPKTKRDACLFPEIATCFEALQGFFQTLILLVAANESDEELNKP